MSDAVTKVILGTRLDPGVHLNDTYEIDERIASGGMGEVYRGHNIQTGEPVAIKTILPELADKEAIFALFKKEATILGRLYHDTIVRYYSFSRDPRLGRPYLAMEFVDGVSLAERLKDLPLTAGEVCQLFPGIAEGLALAHKAGVIHRDVSPDNIILRDGDVSRPKLIDFGIARSANFGEGTLIGGGFAGKYNFISPEQLGLRNREVDGRSDIYSLGLVIAASLRGRPLDMGGSHVDVIEKRNSVPDLSDIDESLRPLITSMLQPDPDNRPANATVVAELLRAAKPVEPAAPLAQSATAEPAAPVVPTAPPAATPAAQSNVAWTSAGAAAGVPFVPDATQLAPGASQPPPPFSRSPFSTPTPPASGESPFGGAPAYPAAPSEPGAPRSALPSNTPAPRKTRSTGLYATAAVLVLVALGAGGAYMTGLIGPGTQVVSTGDGSTDAPETTTPVELPATDTADKPADAATDKPADQAADKPAGAGDAVNPEDIAKIVDPTLDETPPSGTEATETPPTTTGPSDATVPPPETGPTEDSTTVPDKAVQEAAAGLTKMMDAGVSWLHQYDGGKCFFVAVTAVTGESIAVKGFGPDVASFQTLYDSFIKANGVEPELNGHLITESQCAAAEFLRAVQPGARGNPQVTLASDRVKLGDTLTATVDNAEGKVLDLLLVSGDGLVYNVKSFAAQTINNDEMSFAMWLGGLHIEGESPEIIIALTSKSGLQVPQGKDHARATALFLKLARQIKDSGEDVGVDFAYFRVSP
jgi:serine/threonine protein kinase